MTVDRDGWLWRVTGTVLALWLVLGPSAAVPVLAEESLGAIRGVLFRADETTRLPGATVTAINVATGKRFISNHTGDNGAYEITGLPAGTYDLAIDSDDKIYVTGSMVELASGQRLYLSFSTQPSAAKDKDKEPVAAPPPVGDGQAKVEFANPSTVPPLAAAATDAAAPKKKKGFWKGPWGITIITVLVAGAVGAGVSAQRN